MAQKLRHRLIFHGWLFSLSSIDHGSSSTSCTATHVTLITQTQFSEKTPVRSPVRQSPRYRNVDTTSSSSQRTPGKISAYFRSNGMLSAEKKNVEQSPVRQSPRLNKVSLGLRLNPSILKSYQLPADIARS